MPKLYLLGGENLLKRDAREVNQAAFNDAGELPNVLVFSWARSSFDQAYGRRKTLFDYFLTLGAGTINIASYSSSPQEIEEKLAASNLVYLTGGIPTVLIERLKKLGVDKMLSNYKGIIVGRSAGALVLCRRCVITYRSNGDVKVIEGLGFADFTLKAHYLPRNDDDLTSLSKQETVYAVPKGSAIVCNNGDLSFINSVFLFENGTKKQLN
jgi:dipeptidase E